MRLNLRPISTKDSASSPSMSRSQDPDHTFFAAQPASAGRAGLVHDHAHTRWGRPYLPVTHAYRIGTDDDVAGRGIRAEKRDRMVALGQAYMAIILDHVVALPTFAEAQPPDLTVRRPSPSRARPPQRRAEMLRSIAPRSPRARLGARVHRWPVCVGLGKLDSYLGLHAGALPTIIDGDEGGISSRGNNSGRFINGYTRHTPMAKPDSVAVRSPMRCSVQFQRDC